MPAFFVERMRCVIDKRLEAIVSRVRRGCRLADIGTDHAYLPIYLMQHGICERVIAADINESPLAVATQNINKANLQDKIALRLGSGLSVLLPDEVDDIVIAGMGGELIANLLADAPFIRSSQYRLILQPMSRPEKLREFLLTGGFTIENEEIICQGDKLYNVMQATFVNASAVTDMAQFYIGNLPADTPSIYWDRVCKHLNQCLQGAALRGNTAEQRDWERILEVIESRRERSCGQ